MKFLAISLMVLLFASCGKVEVQTGSGSIGELKGISPLTVPSGDLQTFDQICAGLTTKTGKFDTSAPTLTYDVQSKNCDGENNLKESQQVSVVLLDGYYQLRNRATSAPFIFPNAEGPKSGIFDGICGKTGLTMPILQSNGSAKWVKPGGECPGASGEICVTVEIGAKEPNSNFYRVHTREFVRFNVQNLNGKFGHFTYRRRFSEGVCDVGDFAEDIVNMP
jgi:hypothetical protein